MRCFWVLFFCISLFGSSVKEQIQTGKADLDNTKKIEASINKKLEEVANDILKSQADVKARGMLIDELTRQVTQLEKNAKSTNEELRRLITKNSELVKHQKDMQRRFIRIICEDFAYDIMAPNSYKESQDSIIATELINKLNVVMRDDLKSLAKNYAQTLSLIDTQSQRIKSIRLDLREFKQKQAALKELQDKQNMNLADLKQNKQIYSKNLIKIQKQQNELRKTLEKLQILAKKESASLEKSDIKRVGSIYKSTNVKKYDGQKTIAPLDDFSIKQKFGDFVDPVYNIKIFNESIVLRSNEPDAKVRNVLGGTVVFAKDTAVLEKVVITENDNGIHTIYAHLDQIAPTIKPGQRIKKGYVIGRVKQDLTFEVTQKNYHINPLELISMK